MNKNLTLNKKIIFSIIILALFLCSVEIAARTYHFLKYKDPSVYVYGFKAFKTAVLDIMKSKRTTNVYDYDAVETEANRLFLNRSRHYGEPVATIKPYKLIMFSYPAYMNNLGFRNRDVVIEKPDDIIRVVMMGGSFVECPGVDDDKTWEVLLQRQLDNDVIRKYEIINAGLGGDTVNHLLATLINRVVKLNPDYIVLISNYNNHTLIRSEVKLSVPWRLSLFLYNVSRFYAMLRENIALRVYKDNNYFLYNYDVQIMPEDVDRLRRVYQKRLEQILIVCKENNIKLILGTQPEHIPFGLTGLQDLSDERKISELADKLKNSKKLSYYEIEYYLQALLNKEARIFAAKNNLFLFDGAGVFPGYKKPYFIDQIHLSSKGTELFAKALYDFFINKGIAVKK